MGTTIILTTPILPQWGWEKRRNTQSIWFCIWHCQFGSVPICADFWPIWGKNRAKISIQFRGIHSRSCWIILWFSSLHRKCRSIFGIIIFVEVSFSSSTEYNTSQKKESSSIHSNVLTGFVKPSLRWNLMILNKTLSKSCSSWLNASFGTYWVQINLLRNEHRSLKCSMKSSF